MLFKLKKTLLLLSILLFSIETFAVPADKRPVTVKQINGKTLTFILSGDEKLNWANTLDGYTLLHNESGDWVYAVLDGRNNLVPSSVLACNEEERSAEENSFLSSINKNISFSDEQFNSIITAYDEANRPSPILKVMNTNIPTVASDSVLVILVSYSDKPYTYTQADFYNYFAQPNFNGTGSLRDYYLDQSGGLFDMKFRVVGPYTLPNTSAYYANRGEQLAKDAISAADNDVDYTHFANVSNTSGISRVGCVFVMYAGTPQSSTGNTSEVWPHQSNISSTFMKDDVRFSHYVCGPEMQYNYGSTSFAAIGTMCHEFGHALGLPDFYDTGNNSSGSSTNVVSTGDYDLMCSGCYNNNQATPPNWSAYEKLFTDWILKMDTLTDSRDSLSLPVISGGNDTAYLVKVSGSQEFFTLEARRKAGWDAYLPAAGILVHHGNMSKINSWINNGYNSINTSASNRGWFIEPSTGVTSHGTTAQAPFVSNSGV
ncbi:MAG: M6 family metalloprotease domain-containing protein, partial [Bacteroidales bacterium]|nr:M6 family metalloprotease domain-containing protein [Bacteroidales bacterium]